MIKSILRSIQLKAAFVFLVIHAGLICSIVGLATLPREQLGDSFPWLVAGVIGLYGGIFMTAFFILWPLFSLVQQVRKLLRWREWILSELPKFLALIPAIIESMKAVRAATEAQRPAPAPEAAAPCPHVRPVEEETVG